MFHTNTGDVLSQMSTVLKALGPIYAIAFGLISTRALLNKGMMKIFPNYNPHGRKKSGSKSSSRRKTSSSSKRPRKTSSKGSSSYTDSKRIKEILLPLGVQVVKPAKRQQSTTIFFDSAKNAEAKKGDKGYFVYYTSEGNRKVMYLESTRNPKINKVGNTLQVSFD